ncbi:hypothetical protein R3I94_021479 [Phoxinus phoxinus]
MIQSRISNVPFLDGANCMYRTTNKSHFKSFDNTAMPKRAVILVPVSTLLQRGDQNYQGKDQTETAMSFPSHPLIHVIPPMITHLTMQRTNFKMHSENRCGDFETTQADFKPLPMSAAQIIRPTTAVRISLPGSKCPETTYRSSYTKHEVSSDLGAKETVNTATGVGSSLKEDKKDEFSSSYNEQFQYRWCPTPSPLQSTENQRIQYSSVAMGDREKILGKQTTYSSSFSQSGAHSYAKFRECLLPKINKSRPINLRELADEKWITTSSEEFRAHKCGPIHLERRDPNLSSVFKGESLEGNQERLSTTNQCFFPKIDRTQFPEHVDGSGIRTLSDVKFGRPDLAGCFYSTTSQEQFPSKEVDRPKPPIYPPSYVLLEQEPDRMLSTVQKDFVPLNSRRQELSPSQLQQVKGSHIRPRHSKHDFRTTHNEAFVPKPYCKASLDNPPLQHISHMAF